MTKKYDMLQGLRKKLELENLWRGPDDRVTS